MTHDDCTDEARCQDYPLCGHARRGFSLDDGDTGATFWPPLCPPEPLSAPDGAGRQEDPFQALTEAYSDVMRERDELRAEVAKWQTAMAKVTRDFVEQTRRAEAAEAEVARPLAEIDDRESERADLRDRVTKAEPALARVEAAMARSVESMGKQQSVWTLAELQDDLTAALKGDA